MTKIFLDCGSNIGQGFEEISKIEGVDSSWEVHMFEPNKTCLSSLKKYERENLHIHNVALWDEDCHRNLQISYCPLDEDWTGGASNVLEMDEHWNKVNDEGFRDLGQVECINFSNFITDNLNLDDYVLLKLDIEGSEFKVLSDLISNNTIGYINKIFVEWHERFFEEHEILKVFWPNNDFKFLDQKHSFIKFFKDNDIEYEEWF
jgi:FkbM family methyltransferase